MKYQGDRKEVLFTDVQMKPDVKKVSNYRIFVTPVIQSLDLRNVFQLQNKVGEILHTQAFYLHE